MNNKFFYLYNLVWLIIIIISFLSFPLSSITYQIPLMRSDIFITCEKCISGGLVIYKDIFDHKGNFVYIYHCCPLKIANNYLK